MNCRQGSIEPPLTAFNGFALHMGKILRYYGRFPHIHQNNVNETKNNHDGY